MSDHIDGPRQIGDPSADLTDLFAFTSPENPARTVLAANVFPTCGRDAIFSNAIDPFDRRSPRESGRPRRRYQIRDERPGNSLYLHASTPGTWGGGPKPIQRGTCTFPDGQTLRIHRQ